MKGVWKFVGGCFVGAASAVVMSPKSGTELRRQMALRLARTLERAAGRAPSPADRGPQPPTTREPRPLPDEVSARAPSRPVSQAPPQAPPPPAATVGLTGAAGIATTGPAVGADADVLPEPVEALAAAPAEVEALGSPREAAAEIPQPAWSREVGGEQVETGSAGVEAFEPAVAPVVQETPTAPERTAEHGEHGDEWPASVEPVRPESAALAAAARSAAAVGPPAAGQPAAWTPEERQAAAEAGIADLRARIEQTKAAVRQALEHPFAAEEGVAASVVEGQAEAQTPAAEYPEATAVEYLETSAVGWDETPAADDYFEARAAQVDAEPVLSIGDESGGGEQAVEEQVAPVVTEEPPEAEEQPVEAPAALAEWEVPGEEAPVESLGSPAVVAGPEAVSEPLEVAGEEGWSEATPDASVEGVAEVTAGARTSVDDEFDAFRAAFAEEEPSLWVAPERTAEPAAREAGAAGEAPSVSTEWSAPTEAVVAEPVAGASSGPGVVDQAEMRRRIEETRSRLKAKAFDAMASGESALLAREGADQTPRVDLDAPLEDDVRAAIDASLSQEDY